MAVYAAYRHIELDNVGYGKKRSAKPPNHDIFGAEFKGSPSHLRVLKPPGGGSSDIFGAGTPDQTPRRRVNHMQSSVVVGDVAESPARTPKPGKDTHNRLFGEVPVKPPTPFVQKSKINLCFGEELGNSNLSSTIPAGIRRNPVTGDGYGEGVDLNRNFGRRSYKLMDGNPVTSEGYNGTSGVKEMNNGDSVNANTMSAPNSAPPQRNRVPPGGYSSGLW